MKRVLFTPGPTQVPSEVLEAMARPLIRCRLAVATGQPWAHSEVLMARFTRYMMTVIEMAVSAPCGGSRSSTYEGVEGAGGRESRAHLG